MARRKSSREAPIHLEYPQTPDEVDAFLTSRGWRPASVIERRCDRLVRSLSNSVHVLRHPSLAYCWTEKDAVQLTKELGTEMMAGVWP